LILRSINPFVLMRLRAWM